MADGDLVNRICPDPKCGIPYAIPLHIFNQAKSLGEKRTYYCPNGHGAVVGETKEEQLTTKVEQLEKQVEGLTSIKYQQEEEIDGLHRTIRYWKGVAHRKPKVRRG